jgi:asparagine synthase (glutamine-hydrolysing)
MCGITGRFSPLRALDRGALEDVERMTEALRHRGPDAGGILDRAPLAVLGHRRLSIIDLAQGQQPMSSTDERPWVTFNGEIYNYRLLKEELEGKGRRFRTSSDTEVILAAYEEWGEHCPERLEGMFAFALLDIQERRLLLARDHMGKKPLYVRWRNGILDFASEVQALTLAADWIEDLHLTALAFYLRLGFIPSPFSIYRGIEKLEPGECAVVDSHGLRKRRYWDLPAPGSETGIGLEAALESLENEIQQAVGARLMSEVPLGAFLSGGIDSSLIVGNMASILGPGVKTVTIGFSGDPGETEGARLVARHHRTDHAEYTVEPDVGGLLPRLLEHFGEPFADSSAVPTWYVSREARRRVTVALTGDGGDESFGGYDFRYAPHRRDAALRKVFPGWPSRLLFRGLAAVWPEGNHLPRVLRLANVIRNLGMEEDEAFYHDLCFTSPALADDLAPDLAPFGKEVEWRVRALYRSSRGADPLQAIMRADAKLYLPEDVLVKSDRMSMAHGLEVRSPLLAKRVVELAFSIPSSLKLRERRSKYLLRTLAEKHVPPALLRLPKRGFHIPLDRWLREDLRPAFEEEVISPSGGTASCLDARTVERLWREHLSGRFDRGYTLWTIWALHAWLRIRRARPSLAAARRDVDGVG